MTHNKDRLKTLQWIDQKDKIKNDGIITGEPPVKQVIHPLAKLIPIKDTINFKNKVTNHHDTSQRDIKSCLRGTKLNRI